MKEAIPGRMPDWPEGELPTTKQVQVYLLLWEQVRVLLEVELAAKTPRSASIIGDENSATDG